MSPHTRSQKMGETHPEEVGHGEGTSNPIPESHLASMMAQMMEQMKSMDTRFQAQSKELQEQMKEMEARSQATQNTLYEDLQTLKERRPSQPPTPRVVPNRNHVPEENVGLEGHANWHEMEGHGGNGVDRYGDRFGIGMHGRYGRGMNGRMGIRYGGNHNYGEVANYGGCGRRRNDDYYEEELVPRYDDPTKNIKHSIPEFHGKFDPEAYLEWESQVNKIFSLHNYSKGDKVKLALEEFRRHANTWWEGMVRRKRLARMGEVESWKEL